MMMCWLQYHSSSSTTFELPCHLNGVLYEKRLSKVLWHKLLILAFTSFVVMEWNMENEGGNTMCFSIMFFYSWIHFHLSWISCSFFIPFQLIAHLFRLLQPKQSECGLSITITSPGRSGLKWLKWLVHVPWCIFACSISDAQVLNRMSGEQSKNRISYLPGQRMYSLALVR